MDLLDARGAREGGVAVVEPVHVGEQDEQVGADQVGDEGGEAVVVAEADLVGGHRVVLVHDRHGAHGEQLVQRAVGVAVVRPAAHVVGGEQHLADPYAVPGEGGRVAGDEQTLADAGGGLLPRQVPGPPGEPERCQAGGDGAGGDQDDLLGGRALLGPARLGQHVHEGVHPVGVQAPGRRRQRRRPDLDHDPPGLRHVLPRARHVRPFPLPASQSTAVGRPGAAAFHPPDREWDARTGAGAWETCTRGLTER